MVCRSPINKNAVPELTPLRFAVFYVVLHSMLVEFSTTLLADVGSITVEWHCAAGHRQRARGAPGAAAAAAAGAAADEGAAGAAARPGHDAGRSAQGVFHIVGHARYASWLVIDILSIYAGTHSATAGFHEGCCRMALG